MTPGTRQDAALRGDRAARGRAVIAALAIVLAAAAAGAGRGDAATHAPARHAAPSHARPRAPVVNPADRALYEQLCGGVAAAYDSALGGFVRRDGTPSEAAVELALARGRAGDALAAARAQRTLHWMRALLDTVGGGYVSGTQDLGVVSGSLEKLTSFNAKRLELLAIAARLPGGGVWGHDGRTVADYFDRVLVDPHGGFVTGQVGSRDLEPEANGDALQGWWRWSALLEDPRRRDFCWKTLDRLWSECRDADLGMVRRDTWGTIRDPSLLADQVEMGRALLFAWQAAGRDSDLARARETAMHLLRHFEDPQKGGFREENAYERFGHARRISRPFEDNARAARFLAELGAATGDATWTDAAHRTWTAFEPQFEKPRLELADWALAVRATWAGTGVERAHWAAPPPPPRPTPRVIRIGRHRK